MELSFTLFENKDLHHDLQHDLHQEYSEQSEADRQVLERRIQTHEYYVYSYAIICGLIIAQRPICRGSLQG
jgi:hypothetical protein